MRPGLARLILHIKLYVMSERHHLRAVDVLWDGRGPGALRPTSSASHGNFLIWHPRFSAAIRVSVGAGQRPDGRAEARVPDEEVAV